MRVTDENKRDVVLVTGGAGFIGSWTAECLLQRGERVVIIDEVNDYYNPKIKMGNLNRLQTMFPSDDQLAVYIGDIADKQLVEDIFEKEGIRRVVHLAARAGVRASIDDPYTYLHSNVEGTMVLLEAARKFKVSNFVYASSSSVYGNDLIPPFKETDNTDHPISPYAATKKACEALAYTYSHLYGLNTSGLRFFTVYGPRGRPDMAIFKFIDKIYNGVAIDQYGDGNSMRDYTYIEDIVSGVIGALDNPRKYEIYNLGNGNPVNLLEMIKIMEESLGIEAKRNYLPMQAGDVDLTCADISHAQEVIGYKPKTRLREGIEKTVKWYKEEYVVQKLSTSAELEVPSETGKFMRNKTRSFSLISGMSSDLSLTPSSSPSPIRKSAFLEVSRGQASSLALLTFAATTVIFVYSFLTDTTSSLLVLQ